MVELETYRNEDMISSRDVRDVQKWIRKFPNIELVSRDGAQIYVSAIRGPHPPASQISDRFHIIKGLSETLDRVITRTYPIEDSNPSNYTSNSGTRRIIRYQ